MSEKNPVSVEKKIFDENFLQAADITLQALEPIQDQEEVDQEVQIAAFNSILIILSALTKYAPNSQLLFAYREARPQIATFEPKNDMFILYRPAGVNGFKLLQLTKERLSGLQLSELAEAIIGNSKTNSELIPIAGSEQHRSETPYGVREDEVPIISEEETETKTQDKKPATVRGEIAALMANRIRRAPSATDPNARPKRQHWLARKD